MSGRVSPAVGKRTIKNRRRMLSLKVMKIIIPKIGTELLSAVLALLFIYLFWQNNVLLTGLFILLILFLLITGKNPREIYLVVLLLISSSVIEIIALRIGFESYTNPTFLGIPLWLPFMWGLAGLIIWRVAKSFVNNEKASY